MTGDELDAIVRFHQRHRAIPWRLNDIAKWIADIKANPADVRNKPDVQPRRDGGTFVSEVTNLDDMLKHVETVWRHFRADEFELALSSLGALETRVVVVNARVTNPVIKHGKTMLQGQGNIDVANARRRQEMEPKWEKWSEEKRRLLREEPESRLWKRQRMARQIQMNLCLKEHVKTIAKRI